MLSREDILKAGARKLLEENEKEREALLKILGEPNSTAASSGVKSIVRRNIKKHKKTGRKKGKPHWTQTPAGRARMVVIGKDRWKKAE